MKRFKDLRIGDTVFIVDLLAEKEQRLRTQRINRISSAPEWRDKPFSPLGLDTGLKIAGIDKVDLEATEFKTEYYYKTCFLNMKDAIRAIKEKLNKDIISVQEEINKKNKRLNELIEDLLEYPIETKEEQE